MAETTITGLPNATTPLSGSERVPMDQAGVTVDASTQQIANLAPGTNLGYTAATRTLSSSTGDDVVLPEATTTAAGLQSVADKTRIDQLGADDSPTFAGLTVTGSAPVVIPHIHGSIAGDFYIHVRNTSGDALAAGTAVYATGPVGDTERVTVSACDPTDPAKMPAIGLLQTSLSNNGNGDALVLGELRPFNTSAFLIRDRLYVGAGGALTATIPTSGLVQSVGSVARVNAQTGTILVGIGAAMAKAGFTGDYDDLTDKPTLGTAAALDVGTTTGTVAAGDDSRFTDAREWTAATISQAEAEAGTETTRRAFTAQRVFQAIAAWWAASTAASKLAGIEAGAQVNVATDLSYTASTRLLASSTGADVNLPEATTALPGLMAAADKAKLDGVAAGAEVNVNADWNASSGDAQIQNKPTIPTPGGSSTELQYRNSGAFGAVPNSSVDGTGAVTLARLIAAANGAASAPPVVLTGTWFTGGSATTTKPALLIEPAGTTSTAWSTDGTGLGVNAPSGFPGRLLDLQLNGASTFSVASTGRVSVPLGTAALPSIYPGTDTNTGFWSPTADTLAASTNGAERLRITSAGSVGIGTTNPNATLDIVRGVGSGNTLRVAAEDNHSIVLSRIAPALHPGSVSLSVLSFGQASLIADNQLLFQAGANEGIVFNTSGATQRARIDSNGRLLVGTSTGRNIAGGAQGGIQYETTGFGGISITNNKADASGANIAFGKQRSGSVGGTTIVQSGDGLGAILFGGADGTDLESQGARIEAVVDGTPGSNDMPGRLVFSTTADGSANPTERLCITSAGVLQVADAGHIAVGTTTGTKIGTATNQKIGFFNATPVVQPAEITDELTTITHTAPGTADYAIQSLTDSNGFGFVTADEGNTVLSVIANLQTRVNELESRLVSLGLLADAD